MTRLKPSAVVWVILGGTIGTAIRYALDSAFGVPYGAFPWVTLIINVSGSLLLGALLAAVTSRPVSAASTTLRLTLGTGLLGGYTTYSTFAVETMFLAPASPLLSLAYAGGSVVMGFLAALIGALTVRALVGHAPPQRPPEFFAPPPGDPQ